MYKKKKDSGTIRDGYHKKIITTLLFLIAGSFMFSYTQKIVVEATGPELASPVL